MKPIERLKLYQDTLKDYNNYKCGQNIGLHSYGFCEYFKERKDILLKDLPELFKPEYNSQAFYYQKQDILSRIRDLETAIHKCALLIAKEVIDEDLKKQFKFHMNVCFKHSKGRPFSNVLKNVFIKKYIKEFEDLSKINWYPYSTKTVGKLAIYARAQIGYSDNTATCDIINSLQNYYKENIKSFTQQKTKTMKKVINPLQENEIDVSTLSHKILCDKHTYIVFYYAGNKNYPKFLKQDRKGYWTFVSPLANNDSNTYTKESLTDCLNEVVKDRKLFVTIKDNWDEIFRTETQL